jgi:hypothetical protein
VRNALIVDRAVGGIEALGQNLPAEDAPRPLRAVAGKQVGVDPLDLEAVEQIPEQLAHDWGSLSWRGSSPLKNTSK